MSKDKIIKDLKKRNDSLKMQYEYRNIRCIHLEKENERLQQENQQLKKQKDNVVEDIKKQITFCTNEAEGTVNNDKCWMAVNYLKKLLRMLGEIE